MDPLTPHSPSPFLSVGSQYLKTHFTRNMSPVKILIRIQKNSPLGNTQPPHPLKNQRGKRNQGPKCPCNKDKTRNHHLELQSSQTKMPRCWHKNKINNSQDKTPLGLSYLITVGPENFNIAEAQDKDLKIALKRKLIIPLKNS